MDNNEFFEVLDNVADNDSPNKVRLWNQFDGDEQSMKKINKKWAKIFDKFWNSREALKRFLRKKKLESC